MSNSYTTMLYQFIENLSESELNYDDKKIVYEILIDVFDEFDFKNADEFLDIDRAFDDIWYEKYPELNEEEE